MSCCEAELEFIKRKFFNINFSMGVERDLGKVDVGCSEKKVACHCLYTSLKDCQEVELESQNGSWDAGQAYIC